jgi:prepilin-type N-terminal cleavage/methylation domain-containing protein
MKLFMVKSRRHGFTLVELMIVIAIISILATISIVTYRTALANANDKTRAADVSAIMDALEKYYQQNNEYPADNAFNPTYSPTRLPNFTAVKTLLPNLNSDALTGPGDYQFYAGCLDTDCSNTAANWQTYMTKSYRYQSRDSRNTTAGATFPKSVAANYGTNTGWGCTITTYYDSPGYAIAWYSEAKKIWIFKKSPHGQVDIAAYSGGPVAPQTCTFS